MCDSPFFVKDTPVPCGRCPPCKKRRVDEWVFRMLEEDKVSKQGNFVTLTYNTSNVPISPHGLMTLDYTDVQLYLKRLRKAVFPARIKFYCAGEYGTQNRRPHYHIIFLSSEPFETKHFFECWNKGDVHIGKVSGESIAYCVKYIDKGKSVPEHSRDDRKPEFSRMSQGLGKSFLTDEVRRFYHADLERLYVVRPGGHRSALPRYYKRKLFTEEQLIRQRNLIANKMQEAAANKEAQIRLESDMDPQEYLKSERAGRLARFNNSLKNRKL